MNEDTQTTINETLDLLALCFETSADIARMAKDASTEKAEELAGSAEALLARMNDRLALLSELSDGDPNPLLISARDTLALFIEGLRDIGLEHWHDEQEEAES